MGGFSVERGTLRLPVRVQLAVGVLPAPRPHLVHRLFDVLILLREAVEDVAVLVIGAS